MTEGVDGAFHAPSPTMVADSECTDREEGQHGVAGSISTSSVPAPPRGSSARWDVSSPLWSAIGVAAFRIGSAAIRVLRGPGGRQDVSSFVEPDGSRCSTDVDVLDVHMDSPFVASPCSAISQTPVPRSPVRSGQGSLVSPTSVSGSSGIVPSPQLWFEHLEQSPPVQRSGEQHSHEEQSRERDLDGSLSLAGAQEPRLTRRAHASHSFAIMTGSGTPKQSGTSEPPPSTSTSPFSGGSGADLFVARSPAPGDVHRVPLTPLPPARGLDTSGTPHVAGDPLATRSRSLAQRSSTRSETAVAGRSSSFVAPWQHREVTGDAGRTEEPIREIIRRRLRANSSASVSTSLSSPPRSPGAEALSQSGSKVAASGAPLSVFARPSRGVVPIGPTTGAVGEPKATGARRASEQYTPNTTVPLLRVVADSWASQALSSPFQHRSGAFSSGRSSFSEHHFPAADLSRKSSVEEGSSAPVRRWGSLPLPPYIDRETDYQTSSPARSARVGEVAAERGRVPQTVKRTSVSSSPTQTVVDKAADMWLFSPTPSQSAAKVAGDREGGDPANRRSTAPPLTVHHLETESEQADDGTTAIATGSPAVPDSPVHWLAGTERTTEGRPPFSLPQEVPRPPEELAKEDGARLLLQRLQEVAYPAVVVAYDERPKVVLNLSPNFQPQVLLRRGSSASVQMYTDLPMPVHEAFERPPPRLNVPAPGESEAARIRESSIAEGTPDALKRWLLGESRSGEVSTSAGSSREGAAVYERTAEDQEWLWEMTVPTVVFHPECKRDTMKSSGGSDKVYRPYVVVDVTSEWWPSVQIEYVPDDDPGTGGRNAKVKAACSSVKSGKAMEGPGICIWSPHKPETLDRRL